jgi:folate-binding Fe-S cluster repair protein YgfZ
MTVAQAGKVLSAVGVGAVTEEMLHRHIAAGAPTTTDGRINLVHYGAWLNQWMGKDEHGA